MFPCINENCKEKLEWGTVQEHERQCAHATIKCPVPKCEKLTEIRNLCAHFQEHCLKAERKFVDKFVALDLPSYKAFCITFKSYIFIGVAKTDKQAKSICTLSQFG